MFDPVNVTHLGVEPPLRFTVEGDPVGFFDSDATSTLKAPDFNLEAITNVAKLATAPSLENAAKTANNTKFDSLLGLHKMSGSYSSHLLPKTL